MRDDSKLVHRNYFKACYGEHLTQDVFGDDIMERVDTTIVKHNQKIVYKTLASVLLVFFVVSLLAVVS